ncbi:hypothetical protein A6R68_11862 [Neotoma lepida]|uniref:Uncharacterized protein n=1 Tax=Neotoma lepida TaxID=56216 RepID=A0A1A6FV63_NEOLE|nr:hypothetical protein A6R68_11862 [Neotoma lepida]
MVEILQDVTKSSTWSIRVPGSVLLTMPVQDIQLFKEGRQNKCSDEAWWLLSTLHLLNSLDKTKQGTLLTLQFV